MKKITLAALLFAVLSFGLTSCLKDKGFENGEYGINDPDTQPPGVGFPEATNEINSFAVNSINTPQTINAPFVNILGGQRASSDVHVELEIDNSIVTDYNTAHGTTLQVPTAAEHTISSLTVTIPAGERFAILPILIADATGLSLTTTYALGFRIKSVDGGYRIASNLDEVLVTWSVKNAYDGIYTVEDGFVQRFTAPGVPESPTSANGPLSGALGHHNPDVILSTAGPTSVSFPAATTGGLTWATGASYVAGIAGLKATVNPATNDVTMSATEAPGGLTLANWSGSPLTALGRANKYDPATKTFYLAFFWNPTSNTRTMWVVLQYDRPR